MTPFGFVVVLLSILFSIAIAHMLQSVADLVRAGRRVRFSGLHAVWMLAVFLSVLANWLSVWELRTLPAWPAGYTLFLILAVLVQYLACALVSPRVEGDGPIDLGAFHREQGSRYLLGFGLLNGISVPLNIITAGLFAVPEWGWQNLAQGPAAVLTLVAIFVRPRWAQWTLAAAVLALTIFYLAGLEGPVGIATH